MKNIFLENNFYKDAESKAKLEKDKLKIKNIFWTNFIGFVALRKSFPDNQKILNYFKEDNKLQIDHINDDNSDFSLSLKLFYDAGFLPLSVVKKITKFMFLMKKGKEVDEQLFRDNILKNIYMKCKMSKIKASKRIMTHVDDFFEAKKTLYEILPNIYTVGVNFRVAPEFVKIAKSLVIANSITIDNINDQQKVVIDKQKMVSAIQSKTPIITITTTTKTKLDVYIDNIDVDTFLQSTENISAIMLKILKSDSKEIELILKYFSLKKSDVKQFLDIIDIHSMENICKKLQIDKVITDNFYNIFIPKFFVKLSQSDKEDFLKSISTIFDDYYSKNFILLLREIKSYFPFKPQADFDINKFLNNLIDNYLDVDFENLFQLYKKFHSKINKEVFEKIYNLTSGFKIIKFNTDFKNKKIRKILNDIGVLQNFVTDLDPTEKSSLMNFNYIVKTLGISGTTYRKFELFEKIYGTSDIFKIIEMNGYLKEFKEQIESDSDFLNQIIRYFMANFDESEINYKILDIIIKNDKNNIFLKGIFKKLLIRRIKIKKIDEIIWKYKKEFEDFMKTSNFIEKYDMLEKLKFYSLFTDEFIFEYIFECHLSDINETFYFFLTDLGMQSFQKIGEEKIMVCIKQLLINMSTLGENYILRNIQNFFIEKYKTLPEWFEKKYIDYIEFNTLIQKIIFNLNFKPTKLTIKNCLENVFDVVEKHPKDYDEIGKNKSTPNPETIEIYNKIFEKIKLIANDKLNDILKDSSWGFSSKKEELIFQNLLKNFPDLRKKYINGINEIINKGELKIGKGIKQEDFEIYMFSRNFIDDFGSNKILADILLKNINDQSTLNLYLDDYLNFYLGIYEKNPDNIEIVLNKTEEKSQKIIVKNLKNKIILNQVYAEIIKSDDSLIKPNFRKLENLRTALKFNNFNIVSKIRIKKNESFNDFFKRIEKTKVIDIPKQNIELEVMTEEEKELKMIEWYKKYYTGVHGNNFVKILDSYKVNWKLDEYNKFLEKYPNTTMVPCFHGTGSIAASMILRFGFTVQSISNTSSSGISAAGRMLGDGIYFAPNIDKVMAYCSDGSWTHKINEEGYIFEMSVITGEKGIHFDCAGVENQDTIKSSEYCVFKPEEQINIYKAYRVKQIPVDYIKELANKYQK